jgi:hypothetical protein
MSRNKLPDFLDQDEMQNIIDYDVLFSEAVEYRKSLGINDSCKDGKKTCLVIVDAQISSAIPTSYCRSLAQYICENISNISKIFVFSRLNMVCQMFFPVFWVDKLNRHPKYGTVISVSDIDRGIWKIANAMSRNLPSEKSNALIDYVRSYIDSLDGDFYIRKYSTMTASPNAAVVPIVDKALFFYSIVRRNQTLYQYYDNNPLLEFDSIFEPKNNNGMTGSVSSDNNRVIPVLGEFDEIIFAGNQKTVSASIADLYNSSYCDSDKVKSLIESDKDGMIFS